MGLNNYPYTNFHELNADWIISKVKELSAEFVALQTDFGAVESDFEDLKTYVENYFATLDLSGEVRDYMNELLASGYIDNIVSQMVEEGYFRTIINDVVHNTNSRVTQHNDAAVNEMLEVLDTYKSNRANLYYGNNGALNVELGTDAGKHPIDCSTFVLLGLKGVPYWQSRYYLGGDRDNNNSMFAWGVDIYSGKTKNVSGTAEYYRYSTDIARWFFDNSLMYKPTTTFDNVKIGDVLFWVDESDVDNDDVESTLSGVRHCAIFTGIDGETGNIKYIDANNNRTYVVDDNNVAISSQPYIKLAGALPFLYNPYNDMDIRAKAYLGSHSAKSNTEYSRLNMTSLGGPLNYQSHFELSDGRIRFKTPGKYLVSVQIKVSTTSRFTQWRTLTYDINDVAQNVTEGSLGAFTDIDGNAHNGYANISFIRHFNVGECVGLNTAGASTFMSGLLGTYIEVTKL